MLLIDFRRSLRATVFPLPPPPPLPLLGLPPFQQDNSSSNGPVTDWNKPLDSNDKNITRYEAGERYEGHLPDQLDSNDDNMIRFEAEVLYRSQPPYERLRRHHHQRHRRHQQQWYSINLVTEKGEFVVLRYSSNPAEKNITCEAAVRAYQSRYLYGGYRMDFNQKNSGNLNSIKQFLWEDDDAVKKIGPTLTFRLLKEYCPKIEGVNPNYQEESYAKAESSEVYFIFVAEDGLKITRLPERGRRNMQQGCAKLWIFQADQ